MSNVSRVQKVERLYTGNKSGIPKTKFPSCQYSGFEFRIAFTASAILGTAECTTRFSINSTATLYKSSFTSLSRRLRSFHFLYSCLRKVYDIKFNQIFVTKVNYNQWIQVKLKTISKK